MLGVALLPEMVVLFMDGIMYMQLIHKVWGKKNCKQNSPNPEQVPLIILQFRYKDVLCVLVLVIAALHLHINQRGAPKYRKPSM